MPTYILLWINILFTFYACKTDEIKLRTNVENNQDIDTNIHEFKKAPPPQLKNVQLIPIRYQGNLIPIINFSSNGYVDFANIRICPENFSCQTAQTPLQNYMIPGLPPGKVDIFVSGCVQKLSLSEQEPSKEEFICGKEHDLLFLQQVPKDKQLDELLAQKVQKDSEFTQLGKTIFKEMIEFQNKAKICNEDKIYTIFPKSTLEAYLAAGPHLIGVGLKNPDAKLVTETVDNQKIVLLQSLEQVHPNQATANSKESEKEQKDEDEKLLNPTRIAVVSGIAIAITKLVAKPLGKFAAQEIGKPQAAKLKKYISQSTLLKYLGLGVAGGLVLGIGVYAITHNSDKSSLEEFGKGFFEQLFLTSNQDQERKKACEESIEAIKKIASEEAKAEKLRLELGKINSKIDLLISSPE